MTGGLLQLVTSGVEDAPLIVDPDITFFNIVYLRHSNFSLLQSKYYLGNKKFNQKIEQKIPSAGDLLSKIYFKVSIPSFNIEVYNNKINKIKISDVDLTEVNSLNKIKNYYQNKNVYIILDSSEVRVIPENMINYYFRENGIKISDNSIIFSENQIISRYLSHFNLNNTKFYILDDLITDPNEIYSLLRVLSNNTESFLLEYFKFNSNRVYFGNIFNGLFWKDYLKDYYKKIFFMNYQNKYIIQNNSKYFNIWSGDNNEALRYFYYLINLYAKDDEELSLNSLGFDLDLTYSYLETEDSTDIIFKSFREAIMNNTLLLRRVIKSLYPSFSSFTDYNMFTFYRVFGLKSDNSDIDDDITISTFTKDSLWANKFGKIYDTLGKIFNIPFYFWIQEIFYKMKTEILLNISEIEIEDKKGLYNIIRGITYYFENLDKETTSVTTSIVNFSISRDNINVLSLDGGSGISVETGMIVSHPKIEQGTTVIKIDNSTNRLTLSSKNGLDNTLFNGSFSSVSESERQASFYFEGNTPIILTIINYQITTEPDSLRLETVDNILVDMIMTHNDLEPGTLVSEIDATNLTVNVKPKLSDSIFISNTIIGSIVFQEFTNNMISTVKSVSIGQGDDNEDEIFLTTTTNLSVGMKLINTKVKSGTLVKSVNRTTNSVKLNYNLLSKFYVEVENNYGITVGMKVKHLYLDSTTEVMQIGEAVGGTNYPNRILISSILNPIYWNSSSFSSISKDIQFIDESNQVINQTIVSFGRAILNNLVGEDIIFINNNVNFSNVTDKYYIENNSLSYNIQKVSSSFPYKPNETSVINPADLYNLYSYFVYDLYDYFINNNIFKIKPYFLKNWRNTINNFIYKRSRKLKEMNNSEHSSFFSTSEYSELSFFCNVLTDFIIRVEEIKNLLQEYMRSKNYYGILSENYSLLDNFESTYLVKINQIKNTDFNLANNSLVNKPLNLETKKTYQFERNNLVNGNYYYKLDFENNKIVFSNWRSIIRKNTTFNISVINKNVRIVYEINQIDYNVNTLSLSFSEKLVDIFGINLLSDNISDIGIILKCGPEYDGINAANNFSVLSTGENVYQKKELFSRVVLEDVKVGMQVSGKFIQEGTFIENVEFKSISSVISTVIKLNKEILVPDNYDNVSIIISTSFDLIEYQQIYVPLVEQGSSSTKFNDTTMTKTNLDFEMDVVILYDKNSDINNINWNNSNNLLTFNYDISSNLDSKGQSFDSNYILSLEYTDDTNNILVSKLIDNGNNSYSINLENENYFNNFELNKVKLYFLPNIVDEFSVSSEQLANIEFSSDNIIKSLFAKNGIKTAIRNSLNNYTENTFKFNTNEDIVYFKIFEGNHIYGLFNFINFDISLTTDQDNVEFKNIKTVVKIKKIIDNLPSNYKTSIIIIRNNYSNKKFPNLYDFSNLSTFTDNYSFFIKKPFVYYNRCVNKKNQSSNNKIPLLYFYNIPFELIGEINPTYKVKCDFFINKKKSFIFSDIGNIQSIKKPYNLDSYNILEEDYLILNGYDSSRIKPETYVDFFNDNEYISEVEIREYLLSNMLKAIDNKLEDNNIFKILKIIDKIQDIYLEYYDDILNNLNEKAGKTTYNAYQNSILINSESIKKSNYSLTEQLNFGKSYITDSFNNYDHFSPDIYSSGTDNSHLLQFNHFILSLPYDAIDLSKRFHESADIYLNKYGIELKNQIDFLNNNYDYFNLLETSNFNEMFADSLSSSKESILEYVFKKTNNYILELTNRLPSSNNFSYNLLQVNGKAVEVSGSIDNNINSNLYSISSTEKIDSILSDKLIDNYKYLYQDKDILEGNFIELGDFTIEKGTDYFIYDNLSEYLFDYLEKDSFLLFNKNLVRIKRIEGNKIFLDKILNNNESLRATIYFNKTPKILDYPGVNISYNSINLTVTIPVSYFNSNWNNVLISGIGDVSNRNELKLLDFRYSFINLVNNNEKCWYMIKNYYINSVGDYILELYQNGYMINIDLTMDSLKLITPLNQINNKINPYGNLVESSGFPFDYSFLKSVNKEFILIDKVDIINQQIIKVDETLDNFFEINKWVIIKNKNNGKIKNYYGKIVDKLKVGHYKISPKCFLEEGMLYLSDKIEINSINVPFQINYRNNIFYFNFVLVNNDYSHYLLKNIFDKGDLISYDDLDEMKTFKIEEINYLDELNKITDVVVAIKIDGLERSNILRSNMSSEDFQNKYSYGKIIKGDGIPDNTKVLKAENNMVYLSNYLSSSWVQNESSASASGEKSINIISNYDFVLRPEFECLSYASVENKDKFIWTANSRIGRKNNNTLLLPKDFRYNNSNLFDDLGNKEFVIDGKDLSKNISFFSNLGYTESEINENSLYQLVNKKGEYIGENINYYQIDNYIFIKNLKTLGNDYKYQGDFNLVNFITDFSLSDKSINLFRLKQKANYEKIRYDRYTVDLEMTYKLDSNWTPSKSVLEIEISSTNENVKNLFVKLGFRNRISIKNNLYEISVLTLYKKETKYYYRIYFDENINWLSNDEKVTVSFYIPLKINYSINNFNISLKQELGNKAEIFSVKDLDNRDRKLTSVIIDKDTDIVENVITSQISLEKNNETFRSSWWYYLDGKISFYNNDLPFWKFIETTNNYNNMGGFSSLMKSSEEIDYNVVPFKLTYNEITKNTGSEYEMSVLNGRMISSDRDNIFIEDNCIIFDKDLSKWKLKVEFRVIENNVLVYKWISYVFIMENDLTSRTSTIWLPTGKSEIELNQYLSSSNNIKFQILFFPYGFFKNGEMIWNEFHWLYDIDVVDKRSNISIYNNYCCVKLNTLDGYKKNTLTGNMQLVNNLAAKYLSYQLVINQNNYIFSINNFENSKIFKNLINSSVGITDSYKIIGTINKSNIGTHKILINFDDNDPRSQRIANGMKISGTGVAVNSIIRSITYNNLGNGKYSTLLTLSNELTQDGINIVFTLEHKKKYLLFLDYYMPVHLTIGVNNQLINNVSYYQDKSVFLTNKLMLFDSLNDNISKNVKYGMIEEKKLDNSVIHFYKLYELDDSKKIKILDSNYDITSDYYLNRITKIKFDTDNNYQFYNSLLEGQLIYQDKLNKKLVIWREINIISKKPLVIESDNKYKLIFKLDSLWSYISGKTEFPDDWKEFGYRSNLVYLSPSNLEKDVYQVYQYDSEFSYIIIDNIEIYDNISKVWTKKEESINRFRLNYSDEWNDYLEKHDDDFTDIFKISHYEEFDNYDEQIVVDINVEVVNEGDISEYKIKNLNNFKLDVSENNNFSIFTSELKVELLKTSEETNTVLINKKLPKINNLIEKIPFYLDNTFSREGFRINKHMNIDNKLSFEEIKNRILIELNNSREFKKFMINKIKDWNNWSSLLNNIWLFNQGEDVSDKIKKGSNNLSSSSWFTINEYNNLNSILNSFNETVYNRFNELRLIEAKIYKNIFYWMESDLFWDDITKFMNNYLSNNINNVVGYNNNWYYYKGCLLIEQEYNNIISNNIPSNIKQKGKYYYREDYFDNQFNWINQTEYIIERDVDILKNNLQDSNNFYGINLFDCIHILEDISKNRVELENLLSLNDVDTNSISNYVNINLQLIFPILLGLKYKKDLFMIDENFFDNLSINYDNMEDISFGLIENKEGQQIIIDKTRLKEIEQVENTLYQDLSYNKETIVRKNLDKDIYNYKLVGDNIFSYKIYLDDLVEDNTIFYQIDFLNGDKIKFDQLISDYYFDSNIINFKLDYNIFDEASVSLRGYQNFNIETCQLIGRIMEIKFIKNLMTKMNSKLFSRLTFKYNQELLNVESLINLDKVDFIIPNNLIGIDYLIVSCLFYIKKTEEINNKTYIYFESVFTDFWDSNISNTSGLYLKLNNKILRLNQELSSDNKILNYVDGIKEFSLSVEVFKYQEVENIIETKKRNYQIIFSGNFRDELQIHNTLINNIKLLEEKKEIEYKEMEIVETNKINIITEDILESKPQKIEYYFNLGESIPFSLNNISIDNSVLYCVNYEILEKNNMEIKVKNDNGEYFGIVGEYINTEESISKIVFWSDSDGIDALNLNDRTIYLEVNYDVSNYSIKNNKLYWIPSTDFELNMNSEYTYKLNGDVVNKNNILFDGNTVIIDNITESSSYQFLEINNPSNKLYLPENSNPIIVELDQFENWDNYSSYQVKSIDNYGSEIGNYLYKVTSRNLLEIKISGSGTIYTLDEYENNTIIKKGWYVYHVDLPFGTRVVNLIEPNQIVLSNGFSVSVSNLTVKFLFVPDDNKLVLSYNNENIGNNYLDRIDFINNISAEIYNWVLEEDILVYTFVTDKKIVITPDILKVNRDGSLYSLNFSKIEYISEMLFKPSYYHNLSVKRLKYLNQLNSNYQIDKKIILFFPRDYTSNQFIGSIRDMPLRQIMTVLTGRKFDLKLENIFRSKLENKLKNLSEEKTLQTVIQDTVYEKPKFIKNISFNLIKSMKFYIGDQLIESIDDWWNYLNYNWNKNESKKNQYNKMSNIMLKDDNREITIELPLWFSQKEATDLPLVALPHSELRLVLELNTLENVVTNKNIVNLNKEFKCWLDYQFVILDDNERELFGTFSHEYLIERIVRYPTSLLRSTNEIVELGLQNLVKEIYFVFHPINSQEWTQSYFTNEIIDRDKWYIEYLDIKNKYEIYKLTRTFDESNGISTSYRKDFLIMDRSIEIVNDDNSEIKNAIENYIKSSPVELEYSVYLFIKYLNWVPEITNSNLQYKYSKYLNKLKKLNLYLRFMFKNNVTIKKINPVKKMTIKANGKNLFSPRKGEYFNEVVSYDKYQATPETGLLAYSFSLHPESKDPSGHLNMNKLDDIVVKMELDEHVEQNNLEFFVIVKEYQILRIMSGLGALVW